MSIFGGAGGGGGTAGAAGDALAILIQEVGSVTYIAKAAPGSLVASAVWQAMKIDESTSPATITWANGNGLFDNVASDLTALSYS